MDHGTLILLIIAAAGTIASATATAWVAARESAKRQTNTEIQSLRSEVASLRADRDQARAENRRLRETNQQQQRQIEIQDRRIDALTHELFRLFALTGQSPAAWLSEASK